MVKELKVGFLMMLVMTVLTGLIYPGVVTVLAQVLFRDQANGSLIVANGQVVGSHLIGQGFSKPEYFHPRPSAAGSGYDPRASGGTNLGPTSARNRSPSTASRPGSSTTSWTMTYPMNRQRRSIPSRRPTAASMM